MRQRPSAAVRISLLILPVLFSTAKGQRPEIRSTPLPTAPLGERLQEIGGGLSEFALFADCLVGPQACSGRQVGSCSTACLFRFDYDDDNDVDLYDFFVYQSGCGSINCDDGQFCNGAEVCGTDGTCTSSFAADCNQNAIEDECDISDGRSADCDDDGVPDECETDNDCDGNQRPDNCDIADGTLLDADGDGVPDQCENVIFVNAAAAPGGDGASWATAFSDLQSALLGASASAPAQVWVAAGTYRPAEFDGDRAATFSLLDGVAVFGGFLGTESSLHDRDWTENETVLCGDLNEDDSESANTRDDNSTHVVTADGVDAGAVIDGFTLTHGFAVLEGGGGMVIRNASPTVRNCTIMGNETGILLFEFPPNGGGIYGFGGSPTFVGCVLRDNHASYAQDPALSGWVGSHGGGAYFESSTPLFSRCTIFGNSSGRGAFAFCPIQCGLKPGGPGGSGGGLYLADSSVTILDSVIAFNRAGDGGGGADCCGGFGVTGGGDGGNGGGIYVTNSTVMMRNCTIYGNEAGAGGFGGGTPGFGGAIWGDTADTVLINGILWNNQPSGIGEEGVDGPVITYSNVQQVYVGQGNISAEPMFVDADGADNSSGTADDDFRLLDASPCINTGDATFVPEPGSRDLAGNPRLEGCRVDMGAFESVVSCCFCDDGQFCNGAEVCGTDGTCTSSFAADCNQNAIEDECDISDGRSADCDDDGVPDECETDNDCDGNQRPDVCDIADGTLVDVNGNGVPDQCENVIFVNAAAAFGGSGTSWADAFSDLQSALFEASAPAQIWVAAGNYRPAEAGGDRAATFHLVDGVAVYGGFNGTESSLYERSWADNKTILSGDLNNVGGATEDSSIHVVTAIGVGSSAILDGVTVTRGSAEIEGGGGIYILNASPTIRNCSIVGNVTGLRFLFDAADGGGIYCLGGSPTFVNCVLRDNHAARSTSDFASRKAGDGGGAYFTSSSPVFDRCTIAGNSSGPGGRGFCKRECIPLDGRPGGSGGGLYFVGCTVSIVDSVIAFNSAGDGGLGPSCCEGIGPGSDGGSGGGLYVEDSTVNLRNCTVYGNRAGFQGFPSGGSANQSPGGAIWGDVANVTFTNSIIWNNQPADLGQNRVDGPVITYSNVQQVYAGQGNISAEPMFVDADGADNSGGTGDDDFRLLDLSPCVNTGDATFLPEPGALDQAGNPRLQGCRVDMGAIESTLSCGSCTTDSHCDDSVRCTDNACIAGACQFIANTANCSDDGLYCNGTEICHPDAGCISSGTPCEPGVLCDEANNVCLP